MRRTLFAILAAIVVAIVACGGGTSTVGGADDGGVGVDGAPLGDAAGSGDGSQADGAQADAPAEATACEACKPDYCGCGQCTDDQVVCTKTPMACPFDCPIACDLTKYKCACEADRCVRTSPLPGTVTPCYTTLDCPPGNCCMQRSGPLQGACVAGNGC
jgi:hypothetical protein